MFLICTIDWSSILSWDSVTGSLLYALAMILFVLGFLGCALPYPGHLVLLGGCVAWAFAREAPMPGWGIWTPLVLLALLGSFTDNLMAMVGARRFGSSSAAILCSGLGMIIGGILFFPIGLLLGPFLGALFCELVYARKTMQASVKSGLGALIGAILGIMAKFAVGGVMLGIFFCS